MTTKRISVKQRTLLSLPLTMLVVVAVAAPALAGTDSDDEDGPPVATATPAPIVQAPAPAPVAAPAPQVPPTPVENTVVPQRVPKVVHGRKHSKRHKRSAHRTRPTVKRPRAVAARTVALRVAPRGGVQAGAGGTAPGLPLTVPAAGLTF
jgi:hypothetical protein